MKRLLAIFLLPLCASASAQTGITVMADTNRAVRTNFTIGNAQVTGLSALLDAKQGTNATLNELSTNNAASLTNLRASNVVGTVAAASNITGILAISNGGTGSSSASNARTALGLGTAATNPASAFQPASTNLDALALNDGAALTNLSATNFLPAYSNNAGKVLAVLSNETGVEWTAISNTVTDGSTITNIPAANLTGVLGTANGGTGASNASSARINLLPDYSNNATKVLALNSNATDVEWITQTAGGGTSGVTSVDVSGGTTGLTTSGGPITNSGTITLGGTLSIAAGGTGQTNAAAAIEALLPAYTNNEGKVLGLDTNLALVWTTNAGGGGGSGTVTSVDASGGSTGMSFTGGPITTNGTLTLGGTLSIGNGGTGAGDVTNARINLLPAYTNNAGKALALNTNGTDIEWITIPSVPVSIANGGTGATNSTNALVNLGVLKDSVSVALLSADAGSQSVVIGRLASALSNNAVAIGNGAFVDAVDGIAIGNGASSELGVAIGGQGGAIDGAAIGYSASTEDGGAVGYNAESVNGFAGGFNARTFETNAVQLGTGTNNNDNSIQFLSAGSVTTNAWTALANSTTFGHYIMAAPTNGTNGQVLVVNSNATGVIWTNVSGVQADLANVTGTLAVGNGGTGATNAAAARVNLLPSYTGNSNYVLTVNSNGTDVVWSAAGSGVIDLATTNATGILPLSKGGVGATSGAAALTNLGVYGASLVVIGPGASNVTGGNTIIGADARADDGSGSLGAVAVGRSAVASNSTVAIGYQAYGVGAYGVAVGYQSTNISGQGVAIGYRAYVSGDGLAAGEAAFATNGASQIGTGTNTNTNSIQFLSAGSVDTTEWGYLANASAKGGSRMTNTNGVTVTNTIIGYDGTNYTTNTITVIDGIITSWTQ